MAYLNPVNLAISLEVTQNYLAKVGNQTCA